MGVQLIYNVVLVSHKQQSESVIHIHIVTLFRFFFHVGCDRVLSRVPCAIQQIRNGYLFYIQQCVYISLILTIYPSPSVPPITISLFSVSVFYFCFVNKFNFTFFFKRSHIQVISYDTCLSVPHFTQYDNLQVQPC